MHGIVEEDHILSNFMSQFLVHTLRFRCLLFLHQIWGSADDQTPLPQPGAWGFQSEWLKSYTCWAETHYFLQHPFMPLKERSWSTHGKRICGFPLCAELREMLFFEQVGVLILQRLCYSMKAGWGWSVKAPLNDHPSHLDFLSSVTLLNVISPFSLGAFFVGPPLSVPVCLYYTAHSSWHILLVLTDRLEGVKSLWGLFLILAGQWFTFKDSTAWLLWGIIDQYQVCSLFFIWLVNLTHSVLISYAVLVPILGLSI